MMRGKDWCILTTAGVRTLPLVRALNAAGIAAWTPVRVEMRAGRGRKRKEKVRVEVPITSTFVFAPARDLPELLRARSSPLSPFPSFNILRYQQMIPLVADASLDSLRAAEARFRESLIKTIRRRIEPGTRVRMRKGAFAGMTGIVEGGGEREAQVNFRQRFYCVDCHLPDRIGRAIRRHSAHSGLGRMNGHRRVSDGFDRLRCHRTERRWVFGPDMKRIA